MAQQTASGAGPDAAYRGSEFGGGHASQKTKKKGTVSQGGGGAHDWTAIAVKKPRNSK